MSGKGGPDDMEISQLERIIARGATLTGATDDGVILDDHVHEAGEQKDKQGRARAWRREEAVVLDGDNNGGHRAQGRMLTDLPDACISLVVSYLSPKDVARGACVCQGFRSTLDSDSVWDQLLPKSALKVVGFMDELKAATKKEMFLFLCKPFLLRETLAYWLDQGTGGVCYSLASRGLRIVWGDDERYWRWAPRPGARWPDVACLSEVCWFHTSGNIKCILPPGMYTLSWRIQYNTPTQGIAHGYNGWNRLPTQFSVSTTDGVPEITSYRYLTNRPENAARQNELHQLTPVRLVDDNWFEFDAGEITVVDDEKVTSLEFSMEEIQSGFWKDGIMLDGVVLRPTSLTRATGRYLSVEELGESSLQHEGPPVEFHGVHAVGLLDPRGRLGGRGPIGGVLPIRRGGIRHIQADQPQFDAGEN